MTAGQRMQAQKGAEQVVGYDARDYRDDYDALFPQQRREKYLYRLQLRKVLSVDPSVWPTVFAAMGRPVPPHDASIQDLWMNAQSLRGAISQIAQQQTTPAFRLIAVTVVNDKMRSPHPALQHLETLLNPEAISSDWQFVGFDVADAFLLSALTNCGFLSGYDDADSMRREWAPTLNEF